jgi:hypothetical protein
VNSRLFAALLLLVLTGTNDCFAKETDSSSAAISSDASSTGTVSKAVGRKLRKMSVPKDSFSVLMPGDFTTVEKAGVRTYTCADYPHGLITAICATSSENSPFTPVVLKELVEKLTPNKKQVDKESAVKVKGIEGTQWDITNNGDAPQDGCQVRGFIVGRRLYILMVYGTKPWIESDAIKQFMDSLEVASE